MKNTLKFLVKKYGKDSTKIIKKKNYWKKYFDEKALKFKELKSHEVNGFIDKILVNSLRNRVREIINKNDYNLIIDCGCGDGSVSAELINSKREVIGIDISSLMCKRASKKGLITFNLNLDKLRTKPLKDLLNSYNFDKYTKECIIFCESLGCIEDPLIMIDEFCANNKNLSHLLFSFPNENSLIRKIVNLLHDNEINYFSLSHLKKIGAKYNYQNCNLTYIVGIPFLLAFQLRIENKNHYINRFINKFGQTFGLNIVVLLKK